MRNEQTIGSTDEIFDIDDISFAVVCQIDVVVGIDPNAWNCRALPSLPVPGINLSGRLLGKWALVIGSGIPSSHGSRIRGLAPGVHHPGVGAVVVLALLRDSADAGPGDPEFDARQSSGIEGERDDLNCVDDFDGVSGLGEVDRDFID